MIPWVADHSCESCDCSKRLSGNRWVIVLSLQNEVGPQNWTMQAVGVWTLETL
jgi:hypothetical protein